MSAKKQLMIRQIDGYERLGFERLYEEFILSKKGQIVPATVRYYHWKLKA